MVKRRQPPKTNLRDFRHKVAELKRLGVVSKRVNASKQKATDYMRRKVARFEDVVSGESIALRTVKKIRDKYADKGLYEQRGPFLIIPKEQVDQSARISRGALVELIFPLKGGQFEEVVLPYKMTDMVDLVKQLKKDPNLNGLKRPTEMFMFRLFGHNSRDAFVDADELIKYIEINYAHLFKRKAGHQAIKHFALLRFKQDPKSPEPYGMPTAPEEGRIKDDRKEKMSATGRRGGALGTYEKQKLSWAAGKKARQRAAETPAQTEKRRKYQREYKAGKKKSD